MQLTIENRTIKNVYFYGTCVLDMFLPNAGMDAIKLLEYLGITVHFPQAQSCCGQPAYSAGYTKDAIEVAEAQLELFPEDWPIIVASGSCGGMMKFHWPKLFYGTAYAAKANRIAEQVTEFTTFLVEDLNYHPNDIGEEINVAVHTSCAARREMNVHHSSWELVDRMEHVKRVEHDHESECCGFGGVFSIRHPDIAGAMVSDKVDSLMRSDADAIVTADGGCLLNIEGKIEKDFPEHKAKPEYIASFLLKRIKQEG